MRIAIGCDHAGLALKPCVLRYLQDKGITVQDFGTDTADSVDYPDFAVKVAEAVADGKADKGILLCGTGIGITIAANKIDGIRAAVVDNEFCAKACAAHNNANILGLGSRVVDEPTAVKLVDVWLNTPFEGGRHSERVAKIAAIEQRNKLRNKE